MCWGRGTDEEYKSLEPSSQRVDYSYNSNWSTWGSSFHRTHDAYKTCCVLYNGLKVSLCVLQILKLKPSSGSDEKAVVSPATAPPASVSIPAAATTSHSTADTNSHTPAPVATTENASNPPTNTTTQQSNAAKTTSGHFSNSGHSNVQRKTTAPVEANGVWVKETLPALKASDK